MHPEKLGPLLVDRLRQAHLDTDVVAKFVGVNRGTVGRWLSEAPPRGEPLNKLWHLLALVTDSPELNEVPAFGRYLGQLMAFSQVTLQEAEEICGLQHTQGVLQAIRGERQLANPASTLEDLQGQYDTQLQSAIQEMRAKLGEVASVATTEHPARTPTPPPPAENEAFLLDLAARLGAIAPLVQYALSDKITDEERNILRHLLGTEATFNLANGINRLCSTRAFREGGSR